MYKFLIPLFALALLAGCSHDSQSNTMNDAAMKDAGGAMAYEGEILKGTHTVVVHTSKGDITLTLDADAAPKTVTNFIALAQSGFYDNLVFHRVIQDFMIQGGDPNGNGTGGESIFGSTFEDEINAKTYNLHKMKVSEVAGEQPLPDEIANMTVEEFLTSQGYNFNDDLTSLPMKRGAIAMANRGPNTNGSQFFIIERDGGTPWLEGRHTVFGEVSDGLDVVDAIAASERDVNDKPVEDITFTVEVVQ